MGALLPSRFCECGLVGFSHVLVAVTVEAVAPCNGPFVTRCGTHDGPIVGAGQAGCDLAITNAIRPFRFQLDIAVLWQCQVGMHYPELVAGLDELDFDQLASFLVPAGGILAFGTGY
ncbi:hypothetical protein D3C78_902280 [compost metagenome]